MILALVKSSISHIVNYVRENEMLHISDQKRKYINQNISKPAFYIMQIILQYSTHLQYTVQHRTQYNSVHIMILITLQIRKQYNLVYSTVYKRAKYITPYNTEQSKTKNTLRCTMKCNTILCTKQNM